MKIKIITVGFFLVLSLVAVFFFGDKWAPSQKSTVYVENFGEIVIVQPFWGIKAYAVVFSDNKQFPADNLGQRMASLGLASVVVDTSAFIKAHKAKGNPCLTEEQVAVAVGTLANNLPISADKPLFIAGLGVGALMPFMNAQSKQPSNVKNLSIGFSIELPAELSLCPPWLTEQNGSNSSLIDSPDVKGHWRSVWSDRPPGKTGVFIKEKIPHADTNIAAYGLAPDILLLNELASGIGLEAGKPPMPIVELPAEKPSSTVTIFYSGDGGWRDLDRSVAEIMLTANYPVLGVDVLRYFWERKTPDEVTADLVATMHYYQSKWGAKSFVLTGFSFGADMLPVIYNKLPEAEKANIDLLVFLALGNHADFEVHVAGWLGQTPHEIALAPELLKLPKNKLLCIYGTEEKETTGTACTSLLNTEARVIELPGGHHFDNDYNKLTQLILDKYRQHGIN
jgi:type IV secretory pathway VirJ component